MNRVPTAAEQPTVTVREGAPWFGVSPSTFYRAAAEGRAPCDVLTVGSRVLIIVASARRVLGLDSPARDGAGHETDVGLGTADVVSFDRERAHEPG